MIAFDPEGRERWSRRARAGRGVVAPALSSLARNGESVFVGATDGSLERRTLATGERLWALALGSAVERVSALDDDRACALLHDGRVVAAAAGNVAWTFDAARGRESTVRPRLTTSGGVVWVHVPATERLHALDAVDGALLLDVGCPRHAAFAVDDHDVVVVSEGVATARRVYPPDRLDAK